MKKTYSLLLSLVLLLVLGGCGGEDSESSNSTDTPATENIDAPEQELDSEPEAKLTGEVQYGPKTFMAPYKSSTPKFKEWYNKTNPSREIDLNQDVSWMPADTVFFLMKELLGRNGFMYMDDIVRAKLAYTTEYQPVFWDENYKTVLSEEEKAFLKKLESRMAELKAEAQKAGPNHFPVDQVVNRFQFKKDYDAIRGRLKKDGFVIRPTEQEQLFHLYDMNNYSTIPSFVTTDLYLQVFHMYFTYLLRDAETTKLIQTLTELTAMMYEGSVALANYGDSPVVKEACGFNAFYFGVAYSLLTGKDVPTPVPANFEGAYKDHLSKARAASGQGSEFLEAPFFDFSLLKPRGHYTRTEALSRYFKAMMWLQTAPMMAKKEEAINGALVMGSMLAGNENTQLLKDYKTIFEPLKFIAGEPNKLAVSHLVDILKKQGSVPGAKSILEPATKANLLKELSALKVGGYAIRAADKLNEDLMKRVQLVFFPQRYVFDGEILSRLVHVERDDLNDESKRPVPKALDVFAALGNPLAKDLLLNHYKTASQWPDYPDSLAAVTRKFSAFDKWDENVYNKWMGGLKRLFQTPSKAPKAMLTDAWKKKDLTTALGSFAELKHDLILYADQPMAAQMGDGGEWPDPYLYGYVEPKISFWKNCLELLDLTSSAFGSYGLLSEKMSGNTTRLKNMANQFLEISEKELRGELLSTKEMDFIRYIGGNVESLTLDIMDSNVSWYELSGPDKFVAVVADVYTYQGAGKKVVLEEAVGYADEILVMVEYNGLFYLMRGATLSYYEFEQPINQRLTDEEWQQMLKDGKAPARPTWYAPQLMLP